MRRRYAVAWTQDAELASGRLDAYHDRFELHGRTETTVVPFNSVRVVAIERGPADRLRGLPVLALWLDDGRVVRIASLEGPGVLHELSGLVERSGLTLAS